jgi:hypothetical protein
MERIARGKVKYVGYFESDLIRCASDPIRNLLEEALRVFEIDEAALICPHAEWIEKRLANHFGFTCLKTIFAGY